MTIEIIQKSRISNWYDIIIDEEIKYSAARESSLTYSDLRLFDINGNCVAWLRNRSTVFKTDFNFRLTNGDFVNYKSISWRGHYNCLYNQDTYDIYRHLGNKYSIYKNNSQIAWWDNNVAFSINKDRIRVTANTDCDELLIIAFVISTTGLNLRGQSSNALSMDIGNIIPGLKKFNYNWQPH